MHTEKLHKDLFRKTVYFVHGHGLWFDQALKMIQSSLLYFCLTCYRNKTSHDCIMYYQFNLACGLQRDHQSDATMFIAANNIFPYWDVC